MKQVYKGHCFEVLYDNQNSLIESRWTNTQEVTEDLFKQEMLNYVEIVRRCFPEKFLVDNSNNEFVITIELQEWINENVFPQTAHPKTKKFALVVASEIFAQVSLEQTIETAEEHIGQVPTQYFESREEAMHWLLQ